MSNYIFFVQSVERPEEICTPVLHKESPAPDPMKNPETTRFSENGKVLAMVLFFALS